MEITQHDENESTEERDESIAAWHEEGRRHEMEAQGEWRASAELSPTGAQLLTWNMSDWLDTSSGYLNVYQTLPDATKSNHVDRKNVIVATLPPGQTSRSNMPTSMVMQISGNTCSTTVSSRTS